MSGGAGEKDEGDALMFSLICILAALALDIIEWFKTDDTATKIVLMRIEIMLLFLALLFTQFGY